MVVVVVMGGITKETVEVTQQVTEGATLQVTESLGVVE